MDAIADTAFTEVHAEVPIDDPSLLVIVLELASSGWYNIRDEASIIDVFKSLLVFMNGHLALNSANQVAFILGAGSGARFLFPNPNKTYDDVQDTGLVGNGMYRQFRRVDEAVLDELNSAIEQSDGSDTKSTLSAALSLALTYTNRMLKLDQSINTTTASAISSATNSANKNDMGSAVPVGSGIKGRILVVTPNDHENIKYISLMNSIFAAQKMKVSIDVAKLGRANSAYLQQAADATNGIYLHIEKPRGFIQVLSTAYFIEPSIRPMIMLPTNSNVNYKASCFITGKSVEIGYVCSVCLCIMSEIPGKMACPTCNSPFDEKMIASLQRKPVVKKRKVDEAGTSSRTT